MIRDTITLHFGRPKHLTNEVKRMRIRIALAFVAILLMAPIASAHGANTFSFIMRNSSVQPDEASVQQNDTLIFYNVVSDRNRTLSFSADGGNGTIDWQCEAGPSDSMSTEDECYLWLDPEVYDPILLEIQIFNNGSLWHTVLVTVLLDNHTETGPPEGGFLLPGGGQRPADADDDGGELQSILLSGAILAFGAVACIWILRNIRREDSNNVPVEAEEE